MKKKTILTLGSLLLPLGFDGNSAFAEYRQQVRYFGGLGMGTFDGKYPYAETDSGTNVSDMSRFGLNISVTDDRELSFFTEILAQPNQMEAPWYFVNWRASDSIIIRAGKTRFANWLYSETKSIGYTYPWPELPADVYRINPLTSMYGVSAEYSLDTAVGGFTLDIQMGSIDAETLGTKVKSDIASAATVTYQKDDVKWIFSGLYTENLKLELSPLLVPQVRAFYVTSSIKSQVGPVVLISELGRMRAGATTAERERSRLVAAKARAGADPQNPNDPELQAAVARSIIADSAVISGTTGYLHLGYEIGSFQPYALGVILNADKDSLFFKSHKRYGGGLLWLATDEVAVKLLATRVVMDNKNYGLSTVPLSESLSGSGSKDLGIRSANLIQASIDFLF